MNLIYKILANLKHKVIFMRFGRIYRPDTIFSSKLFFKIMTFFHKKEFTDRKNLLLKFNDKDLINKNNGYGILNINTCLSEKSINSLNILKKKYHQIDWKQNLEHGNKPFLIELSQELDLDFQNIVEDLAPIVGNYIGSWPVFIKGSFWYSANNENYEGRSQNWHMDAEDKKQIKVLIPIEDISKNHGPMNVIPANISKKIYYDLKKIKKNKI